MAVVTNVFEKNPTTEERYLNGLNINVRAVGAPCVSSDGVGHKCREEAVEVEKKEDGPACVSGLLQCM